MKTLSQFMTEAATRSGKVILSFVHGHYDDGVNHRHLKAFKSEDDAYKHIHSHLMHTREDRGVGRQAMPDERRDFYKQHQGKSHKELAHAAIRHAAERDEFVEHKIIKA